MAHPRVTAQRQAAAQERMRTAAATLAQQHGLDEHLVAALAAYDRDPETRGVLRQEAVADLLEALAQKGAAPLRGRRTVENNLAVTEPDAELAQIRAEDEMLGATMPPARVESPENAEEDPDAAEAPGGYTVKTLRELAKARGLTGWARLNKAELAAALGVEE